MINSYVSINSIYVQMIDNEGDNLSREIETDGYKDI